MCNACLRDLVILSEYRRGMLFLFAILLKEMNDQELIERFRRSRDREVIGELFKRYGTLVFGVCMKYLKNPEESQDALMLVFEKLMTELHEHEVKNFKSWLHVVAKNHCLMHLRKQKSVDKRRVEYEKSETPVVEFAPDVHLNGVDLKEQQLQQLEKGIEQLSDEQRTCIKLFFLEKKCYQEVSDITGYSMKQVKSYLQNGKRKLKIYMINTNG